MIAEIKTEITSITEAILIARQARKKGQILPIEPCVKYNEDGQPIFCSKLDPKLESLCKDPDGIMPDSGCLVCPQQKGRLLLLTIPEYDKGNFSGDIINEVCGASPLNRVMMMRSRRPYL